MVKIKPMTVKHVANPITVERFDKAHNVRTFQNPTTVQRSGWVWGFNLCIFLGFPNPKTFPRGGFLRVAEVGC